MRISVKTSQGGGMFGGGPSSEVSIEAADYDAGQATVSAMMILAQNGIGEYPAVPDDETTVKEPDEDSPEDGYTESDDVPAAGWGDDEKSDPTQRASDPGDAVVLVWPDGTSRAFVDNGAAWVSPSVIGKFDEPLTVEYSNSEVTVVVVSRQPDPGVPYPGFTGNQE
ncbi:hypothetical protein SEA_ROBSFEET_66 [Microbacterium phage RobsFeet]|uniref:Uncharacterized protein n=1 Tax=Microbacterium phage RobsFeet TaxID=2201442 RepID=A0A2Z4Q7N5_9CAUD|nr:hypothetical protein HOT43_gp68 [Microbacterium phage RobsFeet]AWY06072.1 hypothetical protein SEA_ROBSFEET_66 [Microbacterium phage RobsFeet]